MDRVLQVGGTYLLSKQIQIMSNLPICRQIGCHREAEMIEQQMKAKMANSGAGPSQQQAQQQQSQSQQQQQGGSSGADYSAQWAEYYRSVGKIEEAEAIEKTLKNKASTQR